MEIALDNIRQAEGIMDELLGIKEQLEQRVNLAEIPAGLKRNAITGNKVMRVCLLAGLYQTKERSLENLDKIQLSKSSIRVPSSFFTYYDLKSLFSALLKIRYCNCKVDWTDNPLVSRIIAHEMLLGRDYLLNRSNMDSFLYNISSKAKGKACSGIPELDLLIGEYEDEVPAVLDMNSTAITNTQVLIAGATGSGKTNMLAVLINQMRTLSIESPYPVNFLLFDYKGEFSDPVHNDWLRLFEVDRTCILNPVEQPLPFSPFKDFTGKSLGDINLYSTEMANALCALDRASISANMSNRLSEAIVNAYKKTQQKPINFDMMLTEYRALMEKVDKGDSITSVLSQLIRANLFESQDKVDLVKECYIIKMDAFPKEGAIAKAIVYFVMSKLNNIYEQLKPQDNDGKRVQLRHFTIIDEAHYMLDFDNRPLRNLIAVGRNKGLSIILATQNMDSFLSAHFDFYANAQYPLLMKQQTINDKVIKSLYGVSGNEFQELKSEISMLQKGEVIIKDNMAIAIGMGRKWKKIHISHLI